MMPATPTYDAAAPTSQWIISFHFRGLGENTRRKVERAVVEVFQQHIKRPYGGFVTRANQDTYVVAVGCDAFAPGPQYDTGLNPLFNLIRFRWRVQTFEIKQRAASDCDEYFTNFLVNLDNQNNESWSDPGDMDIIVVPNLDDGTLSPTTPPSYFESAP